MPISALITINNTQDEILSLREEITRQLVMLDREIAEKDQTRQALRKIKAILPDYARLHALELSGGLKV